MDFEVLRQCLAESVAEVAGQLENVHFSDSRIYGSWLAQSYFYVRHSSRLHCFAAANASLSDDTFHLRALSHIGAEKGQEKLVLRDLTTLGFRIEDFIELPSTKAFYRSQYYFIQNMTPMAFMGYILFLGGLSAACGPQLLAAVGRKFPESASFIKIHAEEDGGHLEKNMKLVESLAPATYSAIGESHHDSAFFYGNTLSLLELSFKSGGVFRSTGSPAENFLSAF